MIRLALQFRCTDFERDGVIAAFRQASIDFDITQEPSSVMLNVLVVGDGYLSHIVDCGIPDLLITCSTSDFETRNEFETLRFVGGIQALSEDVLNWLHRSPPKLPPQLNLLGTSTAFESMLTVIERVSTSDAPVFIRGETGTGKEVAARAIHYLGSRQQGPFIPVNCGAYSDDLFASELFGFEQGAFTDAKKKQIGLVEQAEGGTLFLDEVDSLSPRAQVTLLRFLQDKEYRSLGARSAKIANVRILAASNKPIERLVSNEEFREDLFYRLDILNVDVPSLRNRKEDLKHFVTHFLDGYSLLYSQSLKVVSKRTLDWMMEYSWPGNIRELENYLHKLFVMAPSIEIDAPDVKGLPSSISTKPEVDHVDEIQVECFSRAKDAAVVSFEQQYIDLVLRVNAGNVSRAAKMAGKDRSSFTKLIKKHNFDRKEYG